MNFSDIRFQDLQLFVSVVELPSIARVAEHFETTSSTVSRRLKSMEESLGVRLVDRTTRSQHVTQAGEQFYGHCKRMLQEIEELSGAIHEQQEQAQGHLSVYAPSELFRFLISELSSKFTERYPKLRVEFISGAVKPHLLEDNFDVMIYIDEPQDSSFIARKITTATTNFYASPDYIRRRGRPSSPGEMETHDCIAEINHERKARPWQVGEGSKATIIPIRYLYSSDSITLCQDLAEQGLGITMLPEFKTRGSVKNGKLVQLFPGEFSTSHNVYAMYASRQFVPARIRMFVEFLQEHLPDRI